MDAAGGQDLGLRATQYLEHLHGLAAELERGMDFIARNALADFEESITNQQAIAAHLAKLAKDFRPRVPGSLADAPHGDLQLAAQIQKANHHLQLLNMRYSALLRHSSRSVAQMISLFKSLDGYYRQTSGSSTSRWSCEA